MYSRGVSQSLARWATCASIAALTSLAAVAQQDHTYTRADVEAGQRLYGPQCQVCHGATGDGVPGIDLRLGRFRRSSSDEDLARVITSGIAGAGMPAFKLQPAELTGIVAFIRAGFDAGSASVRVGNVERGKALFEGKGICAQCHRVNGQGPRVAPDLSEIGAIRTLAALQRALLNPTESLLPINRPVRIVTKDGRTIRGRRLNEDTYTVQIIDEQEQLISLDKSNIRELEISKTSPMPTVSEKLSSDELADLIAYLLSLRG